MVVIIGNFLGNMSNWTVLGLVHYPAASNWLDCSRVNQGHFFLNPCPSLTWEVGNSRILRSHLVRVSRLRSGSFTCYILLVRHIHVPGWGVKVFTLQANNSANWRRNWVCW